MWVRSIEQKIRVQVYSSSVRNCSWISSVVSSQPQLHWCCPDFLSSVQALPGNRRLLAQQDRWIHHLHLTMMSWHCCFCATAGSAGVQLCMPLRSTRRPTAHRWPEWGSRHLLPEEQLWLRVWGWRMASSIGHLQHQQFPAQVSTDREKIGQMLSNAKRNQPNYHGFN